MSKLEWDKTGERLYHLGVDRGVVFPMVKGKYTTGAPWNGLTAVNESPDGADPNDIYADNIKYASIRSAENFKYTLEALTYPPEFEQCDGSVEVTKGVSIGQQKRCPFGLSYRTRIGADDDPEKGYIIHLVWNSTASPSDKSHETVNENPDAETFSWECDTTPTQPSSRPQSSSCWRTRSTAPRTVRAPCPLRTRSSSCWAALSRQLPLTWESDRKGRLE